MKDFALRNNFDTAYYIAKTNQIQLSFQVSKGADTCRRVEIQPWLKFHARVNFF